MINMITDEELNRLKEEDIPYIDCIGNECSESKHPIELYIRTMQLPVYKELTFKESYAINMRYVHNILNRYRGDL